MSNQSVPANLWSFFWFFIRKQWTYFFVALLGSIVSGGILIVVVPKVFGFLVDDVASYQGERVHLWRHLAPSFTLWVGMWVVFEIAVRFQTFLLARALPRLEAHMRMSLFNHVSRQSHSYFANHFAGDVVAKINDMPTSAHHVVHLVLESFISPLAATVTATFWLARLQPFLGVFLGGWAAVHLAICLATSSRCIELSNVRAGSRASLSGRIMDVFSNMMSVRLFALGGYERERVCAKQVDEQTKHVRALRFIAWLQLVLGQWFLWVNAIGLTTFAIYSWQHGAITVGDFVFVMHTNFSVVMWMWWLGMQLPKWLTEVGVCRQALRLMQVPHEVVDMPGAQDLRIQRGDVAFDRVNFGYVRGRPVFKELHVHIPAGQKVGLVGFSGGGKTTFVNLLLRLFDVQGGCIRVDGQDVSRVTQDSLRRGIAVIPQDPTLFHRSLADNIRYGRPQASDDEVFAVAKAAHCHDFITQLPQSYDTLVGERGIKLSGGQRQRIAIARALLKDTRIVVLDEATSALDSVTEHLIQQSLLRLMQDRTVIVVAHRLSTLLHMDRLLVFDNGRIVEDGTHEQLLAADGGYARMWRMQAGGFLPNDQATGKFVC
ncbi:MAG: ABC transporter ATP-binding protein [Myxococcota bacterium]